MIFSPQQRKPGSWSRLWPCRVLRVRPPSVCPRRRSPFLWPSNCDPVHGACGGGGPRCPVGARPRAARGGAFFTRPRDATRASARGGAAGLSRLDIGVGDSPAGTHLADAGAAETMATPPEMVYCWMQAHLGGGLRLVRALLLRACMVCWWQEARERRLCMVSNGKPPTM